MAEWKNLFDFQNMSDSYLTLTQVNNDLRADKEMLEERSARLQEQTKLLNRTSVQLKSINLNLSLENSELMEKIENLAIRLTQLTREHEQLVQFSSEQQEQRLNMSETVKHLVSVNTELLEEKQQLYETNSLLREELLLEKEKSRELTETNDRFQEEVQHLNKRSRDECEKLQRDVTQLQEQNQNLSWVLVRERQEVLQQEGDRKKEMEQMMVDMESVNASYRALDLYCPVVNQKSRGSRNHQFSSVTCTNMQRRTTASLLSFSPQSEFAKSVRTAGDSLTPGATTCPLAC